MTRVSAAIAALLLAAPTLEPTQAPAPAQNAPQAPAQPAVVPGPKPVKFISIGAKAPPLTIDNWIKGETVSDFEQGKVYVLEFWSPSSAGSAANMKHLTELQRRYQNQGLVVIGIASKDPRNGLPAVEAAVEKNGDRIGYSVAWDGQRRTFDSYVKAGRCKFLPTTFIIDQTGTVAHMQCGDDHSLDKPLDEIMAGTYDVKKAAEEVRLKKAEADVLARRPSSIVELNLAVKAQDWDAALAAYEMIPESDRPDPGAHLFQRLLIDKKDYPAASEFGHRVVDDTAIRSGRNANSLNEIAWAIVNPDSNLPVRDLDLALKAAIKADEFSGGRGAAIIDTVARVYFWKGDLPKAIEIQRRAIAAIGRAERGRLEAGLAATLKEYEAAIKAGN